MAPGRAVCTVCQSEARRDLWTIADLAGHLDNKRARLSAVRYDVPRTGAPGSGIAYDPRPTAVAIRALAALLPAIDALDAAGKPLDGARNLTRCALWVREHLATLTTGPDAPQYLADVQRAAEAMTRLFDRRPDALYLGPCDAPDDDGTPCPASLYAPAGHDGAPTAAEVTCPLCKARHDVATRRDWLREATADHLATLTELARLFAGIVSARTLSRLAKHGHLPARELVSRYSTRGNYWRTVTAYRVGDVMPAIAAAKDGRKGKAS